MEEEEKEEDKGGDQLANQDEEIAVVKDNGHADSSLSDCNSKVAEDLSESENCLGQCDDDSVS